MSNFLRNEENDFYDGQKPLTPQFLKCCKTHGIKAVSIGTRTNLIDGCATFPFDCAGSVFAEERGHDGLPLIWSVAKEVGVWGGVGNANQAQLSVEAKHRLEQGVWVLKNEVWRRLYCE